MLRKHDIDLFTKYNMPGNTIGRLAKVAPTNVSQFVKGTVMSHGMEQKISRAIQSVGRVLDKFQNVPLDLTDADRILRLIQADEAATFFCVGYNDDSVLKFFHGTNKEGQPVWTPFLLSARLFHRPIAQAIKTELIASGVPALMYETPYGSEDRRDYLEDDYDDVRTTTQFKLAMGIEEAVSGLTARK